VLAATEGYLAGEDTFALWRDECTTADQNEWESSADLWQCWKRWAESAGEYAGSQKRFSQTLEDHGFVSERQPGTGKRGFRGARLNRHDYTDDPRYGS
jgi:phage/plasmid-associated DNA primase